MEIDLGDVVASLNLRVKGMRSPQIRWHLGPALDVRPEDRAPRPPLRSVPSTRKVDLIMDLQADKKVTVSLQWTDEVGNPTDAPTDVQATYTVDNDSVIDLTDNGDGTAVVAATGNLGQANVHVDVQSGGKTLTGDMQVNVVAGLAERVNMVAGDPEEVTPDAAPADGGTQAPSGDTTQG